jgi:hypothetical protein
MMASGASIGFQHPRRSLAAAVRGDGGDAVEELPDWMAPSTLVSAQFADVTYDRLIFFAVLALPFALAAGCLLRGREYANRMGPYTVVYCVLAAIGYAALGRDGEPVLVVFWGLGLYFTLALCLPPPNARAGPRGFEVILRQDVADEKQRKHD